MSAPYPVRWLTYRASGILQECRGWAGRRNDVAHGLVDRFVDELNKGWFLVPGLYSKKGRTLGKMDYRYNAAIINAFGEQFLASTTG
jgi:hypothetical protein